MATTAKTRRRTGKVTDVSGEVDLNKLLREMIERRSSDLHLKAGSPPMMRVDGNLYPASHTILTPDSIRAAVSAILTDKQRTSFEREKELDLGHSVRDYLVSELMFIFSVVPGQQLSELFLQDLLL